MFRVRNCGRKSQVEATGFGCVEDFSPLIQKASSVLKNKVRETHITRRMLDPKLSLDLGATPP